MNGELLDNAGLRCADIDALQLVLGGDQPLGKIHRYRFLLAQLIGDFAALVVVDLDDLRFRFGDPAGRLAR